MTLLRSGEAQHFARSFFLLLDRLQRPRIDFRLWNTAGAQYLRNEHTNQSLILFIFRILLCSEKLSQPSASLEQKHVREWPCECPVHEYVAIEASPLVDHDPDGLLRSKVRMTAPRPEPSDNEATIKICSSEFTISRNLGGSLVILLGLLKVCIVLA